MEEEFQKNQKFAFDILKSLKHEDLEVQEYGCRRFLQSLFVNQFNS